MILYHGTNIDFDRIDIGKTKKYKDFGLLVSGKISQPASPVGTTDYSVGASPYVFYAFIPNNAPVRGA